MNGRGLYEVWAPVTSIWTIWARPLLFVFINKNKEKLFITKLNLPKITYLSELTKACAVIIDLPGKESVEETIALAKIGYRPVPLYNGCDAQDGVMSLVDNQCIENALIAGGTELEKITIEDTAPPVFMLDSNREYKHKMNITVFDNGWDIFNQDFPTANFLKKQGIKRILVRSNEKLYLDLRNVLYKFQKEGIEIYHIKKYNDPIKVKIRKPKPIQ